MDPLTPVAALIAATRTVPTAVDAEAVRLWNDMAQHRVAARAAGEDAARRDGDAVGARQAHPGVAYDARVAGLDAARKANVDAALVGFAAAYEEKVREDVSHVSLFNAASVVELPRLALGETQILCRGAEPPDMELGEDEVRAAEEFAAFAADDDDDASSAAMSGGWLSRRSPVPGRVVAPALELPVATAPVDGEEAAKLLQLVEAGATSTSTMEPPRYSAQLLSKDAFSMHGAIADTEMATPEHSDSEAESTVPGFPVTAAAKRAAQSSGKKGDDKTRARTDDGAHVSSRGDEELG